jgi:hypothetical protein
MVTGPAVKLNTGVSAAPFKICRERRRKGDRAGQAFLLRERTVRDSKVVSRESVGHRVPRALSTGAKARAKAKAAVAQPVPLNPSVIPASELVIRKMPRGIPMMRDELNGSNSRLPVSKSSAGGMVPGDDVASQGLEDRGRSRIKPATSNTSYEP